MAILYTDTEVFLKLMNDNFKTRDEKIDRLELSQAVAINEINKLKNQIKYHRETLNDLVEAHNDEIESDNQEDECEEEDCSLNYDLEYLKTIAEMLDRCSAFKNK